MLSSDTAVYNGRARSPKVTVKNTAGETLAEGADCTVPVPEGRTGPGVNEYAITGVGNHTGTVTKLFAIREA